MALLTGNIRSRTLDMETQLSVILPQDRVNGASRSSMGVLYLLHGMGENASCWERYSQVEWFVRERNIAVIMPEVQRSFYTDMAYGPNYFTYITDELPELCAEMFQISKKRENTCIAGLSMGGYGALKCALSRPDRYAACGSFSGAVDIEDVIHNYSKDIDDREITAILGYSMETMPESVLDSESLFSMAQRTAQLSEEMTPYLYITCGLDDFLLGMNRRFSRYLKQLPLKVEYEEWTGRHDWTFWNHSIELAIDKFFGNFARG